MEEMDKQKEYGNSLRTEIPVNTRIIGTPGGPVVLYLEDYVHTFMKKMLEQENTEVWSVNLYGCMIENGQSQCMLVSGAMEMGEYTMPVSGERYFPTCSLLGKAEIMQGIQTEMSFFITLVDGSRIKLDSFYIYYDQNEEMQNYLIEWNLAHHNVVLRRENDESVRYGRIMQAYNKEEVKVGVLWNVMNILCLGFVVCIMAYAIISINNYHKMKAMENTLDYIVTVMSENKETHLEPSETTEVMNSVQQMTEEKETEDYIETIEESSTETQAVTTQGAEETNTQTQEETMVDTFQQETEINEETTPQYYIVQEGDTLRSISYHVYGTFDKIDEICSWNDLENPDSILSGQKLLLP